VLRDSDDKELSLIKDPLFGFIKSYLSCYDVDTDSEEVVETRQNSSKKSRDTSETYQKASAPATHPETSGTTSRDASAEPPPSKKPSNKKSLLRGEHSQPKMTDHFSNKNHT
jgi:hypothetical protein